MVGCTSHQTKLNALKQDNRINILSREEYNRDIAKLTTAMLELLNNLKSFESKSNNEIKNTLKSETNNETFNINELYEKILKLYPKGIQDNRIWERSGGDISYFSQNNSPKEQWWDALKVLANGGGGDISYEKLISEIKKEFPTAL